MDARLDALQQRLGYRFKQSALLTRALTHRSAGADHNERLEFLGDAVIGHVVSRLLFDRYPDEDEGFLTARRAALVNRDALAEIATELGLDRFLLLGRGEAGGGGASRPSLLAATFEALAGAVALSEGHRSTQRWLRGTFAARLAPAGPGEPPKSAKSRLQEWTQRHHRQKPQYELVELTGPAHRQAFTVTAVVDGRPIGTGHGSSRQRAEEDAAAATLAALEAAPPPATTR